MITRFLCMIALSLSVTACEDAQDFQDQEDASLCEHSFRRDRDWARIPSASPQALELQRQFLSVPAKPAADKLAPARPVWLSRVKRGDFASCMRTSCEAKSCYFHVQIYAQEAGQWKVASEYDLAPRRAD